MMGHPSLSNTGGSSASLSNLSPLAPPFTLDACLPKPKPYPIGNLTEASYAFAFTPSQCNWLRLHPPTSLPDTFSDPNSQLYLNNSTCSPSAATKPYYLETQTINGNPATACTTFITGAFPYDQHSEVIANKLVKADPYYPKYSSALIERNSPSVIAEPDCDILAMSGFAPSESPLQTHSTQRLSTLGYTYAWDDVRIGMNDPEQGRGNLDRSLGGKEKVVASFLPGKALIKQGNAVDGCEKASGDNLGNIELLPRKCNIKPRGMNWLDSQCSPVIEDNSSAFLNMLKPSIVNSASMLPELPYCQLQSPESFMEPWWSLNPNGVDERTSTQLDSCKARPNVFCPSAACASSVLVSQSTSFGNDSTAPIKISMSTNVVVNGYTGDEHDNDDNADSHSPAASNIKDPSIKVSAEDKGCSHIIGNKMEQNDHFIMDLSPVEKKEPSNCNLIIHDSSNHLCKKSELQDSQFDLTDTFISAPSVASGVCSFVQSSSVTCDQFNPVVDSPCWKGSLASRQSPFSVTDLVTPKLVNGVAGGNVLNHQDLQSLPVNAEEAFSVSSQYLHKGLDYNSNRSVENQSSFLKIPSKMSSRNEVHISYGVEEPIKKGSLPGKTKLTPFQTLASSHEEGNIAPSGQIGSLGGVVDPFMDIKDSNYPSTLLFYAKEHVSSSPSSQVDVSTRLANPFSGASDALANNSRPTIDSQLLVSTMKNMSEVLCSICSNNIYALTEQDHAVLQHVINNLDACVVNKVSIRSVPELQCPQSGVSHHLGKQACTHKVPKIEANGIQCQCDHQSCIERSIHSPICSEKQDMFQDFSYLSSDTFEEDDSMIQAIKKVLKKKFHDEDEQLPQILLYKNLWLEAEAALCSIKYKARFARLDIEMEKYKLCKTKAHSGTVELPLDMEKLWNSTVSDSNLYTDATNEMSTPKIYDPSYSRITGHTEDVEASVMDRFHVLKCRIDKPVPSDERKFQEAVDVVVHERMEETTNPCSRNKQNGRMYSQPTNFDVDFVRRKNPCMFIGRELEDGILEARGNLQGHITNNRGKKSALDLEEGDNVKGFQACFSDGSMIQSSVPSKRGAAPAAGGYENAVNDLLTSL